MLGLEDFIIWDKIHNQFLNIDFIQGIAFDNGKFHYIATNKKPKGLHSDLFNEEVEFLYGIGLRDIDNENIYADCSIVEWLHQNVTYYGYFKFNVEKLYYEVIIIGSDMDNIYESVTVAYHYLNMNCLEIIDTIQENKLGLIK